MLGGATAKVYKGAPCAGAMAAGGHPHTPVVEGARARKMINAHPGKRHTPAMLTFIYEARLGACILGGCTGAARACLDGIAVGS